MKWKKLIEKYKERQKRRRKEFDRDLDFLDSEFFDFLKLIFVKEGISKKTLMKKMRLNEEKFLFLRKMATSKHYVKYYMTSDEKGGSTYYMEDEGIDFLLKSNQLKKEEKHSNVIKWATIILAISAFVQIVNIFIYNPTTKEFILKLIGSLIGGLLTFIQESFLWILIIFILYLGYRIYKIYKE